MLFLTHLAEIERLTPSIYLSQIEELAVVVIEHPNVYAVLSLQGAQLLHWQPTGEHPVLWLSEKAVFRHTMPIRGGVPICWPWFGNAAAPSHGFARLLPWQLISYNEQQNQVELTLQLTDCALSKRYWPHPFTLLTHVTLGTECHIELEIQAPATTTGALHTYLHIGALSSLPISGLGSEYLDKLTGEQVTGATIPLQINDGIDRIYTHPDPVSQLDDHLLTRQISLHHQHHSDVVVWNPGNEGSKNISDMTATAYQSMVCVETARISHPLHATTSSPAHLAVTLLCQKTAQ